MDKKELEQIVTRIRHTNSDDGKYWTTYAPEENSYDLARDVDEWGWTNEEIKFVSLYEFLGKPAGKEIGMEVYNASLLMGVKSKKEIRRVRGAEGVRVYPEAWLEMWFRDYDAKLSMEVYNKARAKKALKKINKNK